MTPLVLLFAFLPMAGQDSRPTLDRTGEGEAAISWEIGSRPILVGEVFEVDLVLRVDAHLADSGLVQPFRRDLALPVQVSLPGLDGVPGLTFLGLIPQGSTTIVLNDSPVTLSGPHEVVLAGRTYRAGTLTFRYRADRAGDLALPAPRLHYSFATAFRPDLIQGRVPLDRVDVAVSGTRAPLTITALPDAGRPLGFAGAIGSFTVWATAPRRRLGSADPLALRLEVMGEGHLGGALAAWPSEVSGFQILGRTTDGERQVQLDLTRSDSSVEEIPRLAFETFDPTRGQYQTVWTEPIPLIFSEDAPALQGGGTSRIDDQEDPPPSWSWPLSLGFACGLVVLGLLTRKRPRPAPVAPSHPSDRQEAIAVAITKLEAGEAPHLTVIECLARSLGCDLPGVIGPGLANRLHGAGLPLEEARALAAFVMAGEGASFGGQQRPDPSWALELLKGLRQKV